MVNVLVAGAGNVGSLIACLLAESGDYNVCLIDKDFSYRHFVHRFENLSYLKKIELDIQNQEFFIRILLEHSIQAVISSLPYHCNPIVANIAKKHNIDYFDLTEDISVTEIISKIAQNADSIFMPQCGLAPGFINIAAHSLMKKFDTLDTVKLRVGALPQRTCNGLNYALTWSTDGLINEYGNPCAVIADGSEIMVQPLEGLETLVLDGRDYEAFYTSGGIASLTRTYAGKVKNLDYKTIRYPGHCEKMKFLMCDLKLNEHRDILKNILENAIAQTYQDIVLIYISVTGRLNGKLIEESYLKKIYPTDILGLKFSAIQVATAASITAVVDLLLKQPNKYQGLVLQEHVDVQDILDNRFGKFYQ